MKIRIPEGFLEIAKLEGVPEQYAGDFYLKKVGKRGTDDIIFALTHSKVCKNESEARTVLARVWKTFKRKNVVDTITEPGNVKVGKYKDYVSRAYEELEKAIGQLPKPKYNSSLKNQKDRIAVAGDFHFPFANKEALLELYNDPADTLIVMGDWFDMYAASRYRSTIDYITVREELAIGAAYLRELSTKFKEIYFIKGNHDCFSEDTEVLTEYGWKSFGDITLTDRVGTFNIQKKTLEFQVPNKIHWYDYTGPMYSVSNVREDLLITPNHRLLYRTGRRGPGNAEWKIDTISNLKNYTGRLWTKSSISSNNEEYDISDENIKLSAWIITDGGYNKRGYCTVYQSKEEGINKIRTILDSLNLSYRETTRHRETMEICGRKLISAPKPSVEFRFHAESSRYAKTLVNDKYTLPEWVYKLSNRQFNIFIQTIVDGDGSRKKENPGTSLMIYGKKDILEQIQLACFQHGYTAFLYNYRDKDWRLNINKHEEHCFDGFSSHVKEVEYSGKVGCVTVPNDTVIVRRNGKISITGNCRAQRRLQEAMPQILPLIVHPVDLISKGIDNVKVISSIVPETSPMVSMGEDIELDFIGQYKDCIFGHFEEFCGPDAPRKAEKWLNEWSHVLKFNYEPSVIAQAHIHRLQAEFTPKGKLLLGTGCMCTPMPYQLESHGKYAPPVLGYVALYNNNGITNLRKTELIPLMV